MNVRHVTRTGGTYETLSGFSEGGGRFPGVALRLPRAVECNAFGVVFCDIPNNGKARQGSKSSGTHFPDAETIMIAVGTAVAGGPPHRSVREGFPHTAPTSSRARNR